MSPVPGEAYWVASPLPGEPSGGAHTSVVLSGSAYNARTGFPVIAALRKQVPKPYRIEVTPAQFAPALGQKSLDGNRVVGLDQCRGAAVAELTSKHGDVDPQCVQEVLANVPAQFQLGASSHAHRGERWILSRPVGGLKEVVIVLNDRAVQTAAMTQVLALPAGQPVQEAPLLMIGKSNLLTLVGQLSSSEQTELDRVIRSMFDL